MDLVFISYVVPCYNVVPYVTRCINSLKKQQIETGYDVEFVLVNDGSTDGTLSLLNEFASTDRRAIVIDQENQGVSAARNNGLSMAKGKYVYFLDGDDYLTDDASQIIYEECKKYKPDILILNAYIVKDGAWDRKLEWNICHGIDTGMYNSLEFAKLVKILPISFKIYRRDLLRVNNIKYDEDLRVGEVYTFFLHAMTYSKYIAYSERRVLNYVVRNSGVMRSINFERDKTIVNTMHRIDMYTRERMPELLNLYSYQRTLFYLVNKFGMFNYINKSSFTPDVKKLLNYIRNDEIYKYLRKNILNSNWGINRRTLSYIIRYYFPISISFRFLKIKCIIKGICKL